MIPIAGNPLINDQTPHETDLLLGGEQIDQVNGMTQGKRVPGTTTSGSISQSCPSREEEDESKPLTPSHEKDEKPLFEQEMSNPAIQEKPVLPSQSSESPQDDPTERLLGIDLLTPPKKEQSTVDRVEASSDNAVPSRTASEGEIHKVLEQQDALLQSKTRGYKSQSTDANATSLAPEASTEDTHSTTCASPENYSITLKKKSSQDETPQQQLQDDTIKDGPALEDVGTGKPNDSLNSPIEDILGRTEEERACAEDDVKAEDSVTIEYAYAHYPDDPTKKDLVDKRIHSITQELKESGRKDIEAEVPRISTPISVEREAQPGNLCQERNGLSEEKKLDEGGISHCAHPIKAKENAVKQVICNAVEQAVGQLVEERASNAPLQDDSHQRQRTIAPPGLVTNEVNKHIKELSA